MNTTQQVVEAAAGLDRNSALVRRWFEHGMNQRDAAAARAVADKAFADGFIDHDGTGEATRDREAWQAAVLDAVFAGFSDIEVRIEHLLAQGDLVAVRYVFSGRHTGPFLGRAATGRRIRHTENEIFRVAGGRIAESWGEGDWVGTLRQLDTPATKRAGAGLTSRPERPWTHEMVLVHRVFRRELGLAPALVAAVAPLDRRTAARVGAHLRFVLDGLHVHHGGEDELLWPLLAERAALEGELVAAMESQHDALADHIDTVRNALAHWQATAEPTAGAELIAALRPLHDLLVAHLDEEEQRILPLVTAWITADEWARLAQHGFAHMPKRVLFRQLGAILEDADDRERRDFLATVPPPVRLVWAMFGHRIHLRQIRRIRGALAARGEHSTPPRTHHE
jgi:predicted ester cyclase/hemerythrin-like domain-containing protein